MLQKPAGQLAGTDNIFVWQMSPRDIFASFPLLIYARPPFRPPLLNWDHIHRSLPLTSLHHLTLSVPEMLDRDCDSAEETNLIITFR